MKQSIFNQIKETKQTLNEQYGITKIAVFGSYARDEENENSDIDIVILEMKRKNGFLIAKAKLFLSETLNKEVDIGLLDSIRPFIRKRIEKDLIYV
ncbi:MAG: nucleotidyltransferase domain-containing protein [Sulfuricurvum sp.]|jgi:hypothetical protein|uniref:nucleotidyltransferase family protein n=1 Tax=Sulfuricurvum sp. TaxID=2025608 RepID=UPI0025D52A20|nr:nucleotidyltransferase domain-containing protein [Sulfuricurvum sp.]MCK9372272.1 nucleotidyltransferase domain-containing protein [Sulfuricurvum sp.]